MAEYTISAVLRLRDMMTPALKRASDAAKGISRSAATASKGIGDVSKGIGSVSKGIGDLKNLRVSMDTGDLARLERLKGVMEAAGMKRPIDLRANDSASSKIKKIQQELQNLVGKPWQAVVNVKNNASAALKNMKTGVGELLGGAAMGMGAGILGTAGIGYGAVNAVQSQMDFEKQMSAVKAIYSSSDHLDSIMERLTARAEEMGATTKFTAKEAGEALYYMGMAGWDSERAEAGLKPVLNLAAAGDAELGLTSDIVTDSMTGFHLEAGKYVKNAKGQLVETTQHYADMMAALVTHANTDIPMLGETLKYVAPNVGALYSNGTDEDRLLGAQDTMLIAGLMANSGIKSSQAGTAARGVLTRLAAQNRNAYFGKEIMGVQLEDEETGEARRLKDIFGDFREKFKNGMSSDELISAAEMVEGTKIHADTRRKLETFLENAQKNGGKITGIEMQKMAAMIAGQEAMTGFLAAVTASDKDWNGLSEALDNAAGSTERMAKIKLDNLAGDITYLGSAWDAFQRNLVKGDASAGLRSFTKSITDTLSKANELFKDGIDIGDLGAIVVDVIAKLKAKFLELDGIGSVLAGGTLVFGLKKILSLALKVKDTLVEWSKVRTATDVGKMIRGGAAGTGGLQSVGTMNVRVGTMNVRADVVNLSGAIRGGVGGAGGVGGRAGTAILSGSAGGRGGVGGTGGTIIAGSAAGAATKVLTATQISEQRAARSALAARQAQARADSLIATAWARPAESGKLMAQYERASQRAAQAQARANQEAARYAQLRTNDERAAAYYSKREAVAYRQSYEADIAARQQRISSEIATAQHEASAAKYANRQAVAGTAAGGAAMGLAFGLMDFAATRTTGEYNLNRAQEELTVLRNELKILREQGADVSQINEKIENVRQAEENVRQVSELNAKNERRAGAGTAGMVAGTAVGAALGSMVPVIGNVLGGMLGGFIGQKIGEYAADSFEPFKHTPKFTEAETADNALNKYSTHIAERQKLERIESENPAEYAEIQTKKTAERERAISEFALGNKNTEAKVRARTEDTRISSMGKSERLRAREEQAAARLEESHQIRENIRENAATIEGVDRRSGKTGANYTRKEVFGGTSLGNITEFENWADARGGGMQTVDETSAKVQLRRDAFERGMAHSQSTFSKISANTHEGQERQKIFNGIFDSSETTDSLKQFGYTPLGVQTPAVTVTPTSPAANTPSIADLQRINNETSAQVETPTNIRAEAGGMRLESEIGGQSANQKAVQILPNLPAIVPTTPAANTPSIAELQRINNETSSQTEMPANIRAEAGGVRLESEISGQSTNSKAAQILSNIPSIADLQRINNETLTRTETPANIRAEAGGVRLESEIGRQSTNSIAELQQASNETASEVMSFNDRLEVAKNFATKQLEALPETAIGMIFNPISAPPGFNSRAEASVRQESAEPTVAEIPSPEINIGEKISSAFETAKSAVTSGITEISEMFSEGGNTVNESASISLDELSTTVDTGLVNVNNSAATNIDQLSTNLNTGFETMNASATANMTLMSTNFDSGFEMINASATTAMANMSTTVSAGTANAHANITSEFSGASADVQSIWSAMPGFFGGIFGSLGGIAAAAGSAIASGVNSGIGMIQSAWEGLSGWLSAKISSLSAMASSAAAAIGIGGNATGTSSWNGGFTTVNEHGGELIILPSGEKIYPQVTTSNVLGEVAHNYTGTSFFKGGWSEVNDTGSELMYLPRGTKIINHPTTVSILRKQIREKLKETGYADNSILQQLQWQTANTNVMANNVRSASAQSNSASDVKANSIYEEIGLPQDSLGNLIGVNIPEYNRITAEDSLMVRRAKQEAQRSSLSVAQNYTGTSFFTGSSYSEKASNVREDALGNIIGLEIPEYNRITEEDSLTVKRAKQEAQRQSYFERRAKIQRENVKKVAEIPHNYSGTSYFGGGFSTVNEHGGEIISLSNGTTFYPQATTRNILQHEIRTDRLGNIRGLDVPEYNRISNEDSLIVRRAKYQAQLKQFRSIQNENQGTTLQRENEKSQRLALYETAPRRQPTANLSQSQGQAEISRPTNSQIETNAKISARLNELRRNSRRTSDSRLSSLSEKPVPANIGVEVAPRESIQTKEKALESRVAISQALTKIRRQTVTRAQRENLPSSENITPIVSEQAASAEIPELPEIAQSSTAIQPAFQTPRAGISRSERIRSRFESDIRALHSVNGKPMPEITSGLPTSEISATSTASLDTSNQQKNAFEKGLESVSSYLYKIFHPRKYAEQKRGYKTDKLGNIVGLNGLRDNIITGNETLAVRRAKQAAQRKGFLERQRKIREDIFNQSANSATSISDTSTFFDSATSLTGISDASKFPTADSTTSKFNAWTLISSLLNANRSNSYQRYTSRKNNFSKALLGIGLIGTIGSTIFGGSKSNKSQVSSAASSISDTSLDLFKNASGSTSTRTSSFVSNKPKSSALDEFINIWQHAKKGRQQINFDNIWQPTLSYSDGVEDFGELPFGELPVPNLDMPEMKSGSTTNNSSNSTTDNSRRSTNNFNFGDVNINNGVDFEEFMHRLRKLLGQSASNHA